MSVGQGVRPSVYSSRIEIFRRHLVHQRNCAMTDHIRVERLDSNNLVK